MKRKLKRIVCFCAVLMLFLSPFCFAAESDEDQGEDLATAEDYMPLEVQEFVEQQPYTMEDLQNITFPQLLQSLLLLFQQKMKEPFRACAKICAACILSVLLQHLNGKNQLLQISSAMNAAMGVTVFLLISRPLLALFSLIGTTLEAIKNFMSFFIPVYSSVMITCGQPAASVFYSTLFLSGITLIAQILMNIILPFVKIQLSLHIVGCVGAFKIQSIQDLISKTVKWALGTMATLFAAVLGFQTYLASGTDSIALHTGKLLVGNGIPIIGRAVSDAMGTVFAGLHMMKGSVGILGAVAIVFIFSPVLIECVCYYISLYIAKTAAGVLQCEKGETLLSGLCECVSLYIIILVFFSLLSILGVIAALATGVKGM